MFVCALALLAAVAAIAQALPSVSPEEARQHLVVAPEAAYPPLAKTARIMGTVRIQLDIDEKGRVSAARVLSGHPMLVQSALDTARQYVYRSFEIKGKPAQVTTEIEISFPAHADPKAQAAEDEFQKNYWPEFDAGKAAYKRGDYATAKEKLEHAEIWADLAGNARWLELSECLELLGSVALDQGDYPQAESLFKRTLALRQAHQKPDEAEIGSALGDLGLVYTYMKRADLAKDYLERAAALYEVRFQKMAADDDVARMMRRGYGYHVAVYSVLLAIMADSLKDPAGMKAECTRALKFREYADRDYGQAIDETCGQR